MKSPLFVLLALSASPLATQALINGTAVENVDGTYTYQYVVDNSAGIFDIAGFTLEFPVPEDQLDWDPLDIFSGGDVEIPSLDWFADSGVPSLGGGSAQDFFSISFLGDVLAGETLGGFAFTSSFADQVYRLQNRTPNR